MTPTDAPADFLTSPFERASVQWTADEETAAEVERLMAVWTRRTGRDLASEAFWEESRMRSRLRRDAAAQPSRLEQTRSAAASLVVAAVTAAAPAASLAHPGSKRGAVAAVNEGVLAIGSKGPAVASVQRALGVPADGIFGPKTRAAVVAFQKRHGLVPDGIVGPATRAALFASARQAAPGARNFRAPWVAAVQRALGVPADGIFGPKTRAAVIAFQKRHGLVPDGIVGPQTLSALGLKADGSRRNGKGGKEKAYFRAPWVAAVQRALGLPVDGVFGPKTRAAVVAFQKRHGLVPDGIVGPQTLAALGLRADGSRSNGGSASAYDGPRTSTRGARAARIALRYLGIPYRWGGASPSTGFDCSGFVMYVYAKVGVSLPHRAASQYGYGRPVSRAQLAPGDVVFFNRLGHNGIYLGKGRFIHAPHSGEVVKISSIWDSWYARTWVGARRL